ncbi:unnamed protein product [Didymodactylos carnosus]|uniref:N-acylethanolamine-hydrolyzing acid amidase n=1 Tax=Didymodactylos carnosus TaxID=1234261 RepID=A0A8S2E9M9_9BILA|nr:unnamed protein product [Didymodactylos carnosus]CAF3980006.1 unnamed protein product [Didymodactylos carnosus]
MYGRHLFICILPFLFLFYSCYCDETLDLNTYIIDLDASPLSRWTNVIEEFRLPLNIFVENIRSAVPSPFFYVSEAIALRLDHYIPQPYHDEIHSISSAANIRLSDVILLNLIYELRAHCTSILAVSTNGTFIHGRNLDYDLNTDLLRLLTFQAKFIKTTNKSQVVYYSIHFAGSVGLFTANRPNFYSLSINQRQTNNGEWWMNALMAILHLNTMPLFIFTRILFENYHSYEDIKYELKTKHLIAPVYFILTNGENEGLVITRNRLNSANTIVLNSSNPLWYLVQTNYDHWLEDPLNDSRRTTAENVLGVMYNQSQLLDNTIYDVLSVIPVLNKYTVYTSIMSPTNNLTIPIYAKIRTLDHKSKYLLILRQKFQRSKTSFIEKVVKFITFAFLLV